MSEEPSPEVDVTDAEAKPALADAAIPPETEKTPEERKKVLAQTVNNQIAQGCRVESQSDYQAVVVKGHRLNNTLHLILTIVTLGIWGIFVWAPLAIFGGEKRSVVAVDDYGNTSVQRL